MSQVWFNARTVWAGRYDRHYHSIAGETDLPETAGPTEGWGWLLGLGSSLRVDMVSALRLVIDSEQASILSGGSADLGKLNVAVQSLIALLPVSATYTFPPESKASPYG